MAIYMQVSEFESTARYTTDRSCFLFPSPLSSFSFRRPNNIQNWMQIMYSLLQKRFSRNFSKTWAPFDKGFEAKMTDGAGNHR